MNVIIFGQFYRGQQEAWNWPQHWRIFPECCISIMALPQSLLLTNMISRSKRAMLRIFMKILLALCAISSLGLLRTTGIFHTDFWQEFYGLRRRVSLADSIIWQSILWWIQNMIGSSALRKVRLTRCCHIMMWRRKRLSYRNGMTAICLVIQKSTIHGRSLIILQRDADHRHIGQIQVRMRYLRMFCGKQQMILRKDCLHFCKEKRYWHVSIKMLSIVH